MAIDKAMSAYEAARERTVEENKRKMEALNLHHLSSALKMAPKTPSPKKRKRKVIEAAVVAPSPPRRSRRIAKLPEVKYAEAASDDVERMKSRFPKRAIDSIYLSRHGSISMEARLKAARKAEELESQLDPAFPTLVKPMLHSHVVRGFWLGLPSQFCKNYLPKQDSIVTLVDEQGEEFETNYLAYKNGLSGGWAGFALCHGLMDGDAVVFQLIKPTTFKVHIIRADVDDGNGVSE